MLSYDIRFTIGLFVYSPSALYAAVPSASGLFVRPALACARCNFKLHYPRACVLPQFHILYAIRWFLLGEQQSMHY